MVGRLQVVLLSILPTGAALVYLFWMYGWKKQKHTRSGHCQKPQIEVTHSDCERDLSEDNVSSTLVPCSEQTLSSSNKEHDDSAESHVSSGASISDEVSVSPRSSCVDLRSPCGDKSVSATTVTCEKISELVVDVGSTSLEHDVAPEANQCHSENVGGVSETRDNAADEDEGVKCPAGGPQDSDAVTSMEVEDEKFCNICVTNGHGDDDKLETDSGCVPSNVPSEECENGRRDSIESVKMTFSRSHSVLVCIVQFEYYSILLNIIIMINCVPAFAVNKLCKVIHNISEN